MKALAALSRRIARIEAALPSGNGAMIRVGKGMRGLVGAMQHVAELSRKGLLPEPDLNGPMTPIRAVRAAIAAEKAERAKRKRLSLESAPALRSPPMETLKAEETLIPKITESAPCSPTPAN